VPDRPRLVVLDTNVVVSGLLSPAGPPGQILGLTLAGKLTPAHDVRILAELSEVLRRSEFTFSGSHIQAVLEAFERDGISIVPGPLPGRLPDPTDEPFLEVAAAARAVLVTGNLRHFPAGKRFGVDVLSPRQLLDRLR
jgi:putative PIN family toxin of toxin-antitoxin system